MSSAFRARQGTAPRPVKEVAFSPKTSESEWQAPVAGEILRIERDVRHVRRRGVCMENETLTPNMEILTRARDFGVSRVESFASATRAADPFTRIAAAVARMPDRPRTIARIVMDASTSTTPLPCRA